jgi:hypothetical protein
LQDFYNFNFEKLLLTDATVTGIVNNILYAIDAFGKKLKFLIKLIISVAFFWQTLVRFLILKRNQDQKNYHVLKNLQD